MGSDNSPESTDALCVEPFGFNGIIGVARRDITPPVGIYARQWGATLQRGFTALFVSLFYQ